MPRRLYGFFFLFGTIGLLTLAAIISAFTGHPGKDSAAAAGKVPQAVTTQVAAAVAAEQPAGVWTDIATFPAAVVSPTPGTNPLHIKRAGAAAYFPNGNVYLLGGRHGVDGQDVALRWIWQYAPGSNTWTQKAALLDGTQQGSIYTANMAVAVLTNSNGVRIYAVGGNSIDSVPTPVTRVYDPVADSLTTDDNWPASPARIPGGWAVYNNVLYVFGGFSDLANGGNGGVFTDTWKFDPSQPSGSRWTQVASANLTLGRAFIAGATLDGFIYAIGGATWTPGHPGTLNPQTIVERMDPSQPNPTWTVVASLPTARSDMGAWAYDTGTGYEISGKIAVAGGPYPTPDNTGYLYDRASNSWSAFSNLVHATRDYGFAQLNGMLYALGGYDGANMPDGANFNQAYNATVQGTPTPTITGTPPTATRTSTPGGPTSTATRTATPTPTSCTAAIQNGGFETGNLTGWTILGTNPPPVASNAASHSGTYSALLGTVSGTEPNGDGSMYQTITVPPSGGTLTFWWNGGTTDSISFDWQDAYITDTSGTILATIMHDCQTTGGWLQQTFSLAPYAGQTVRVEFLVHQDGFGDDTYMYVDDVSLQVSCGTATVTPTSAPPSPTVTAVVTQTPTRPPTSTVTPVAPTNTVQPSPIGSATAVAPSSTSTAVAPTSTVTSTAIPPTATAAATECAISFSDVHPTDYFYEPVRYLYCHGVVSGYGDNTFRPYNETTRAQMVKIVVLGFGIPVQTPAGGAYTFHDVPPAAPFFDVIETAAAHNIISGYNCGPGGPGPCDPQNRPYFLPNNPVTRGQLSKIDVIAAGWPQINPTTPTFTDVPQANPFYSVIETAVCHGVVSGYADHTFHPFANATRGQIAKIVYISITEGPGTCAVTPTAR